MQPKKIFFLLFCILNLFSIAQAATEFEENMYIPSPQILGASTESMVVPIPQVIYDNGPRSNLFSVFRDRGEYNIDKNHFDAQPDSTWGLQTSQGFFPLGNDESHLQSCKLKAFATCQFVGTMWEDYCNAMLKTYNANHQSPKFITFLSLARTQALRSPVQIFCSSSCYDESCSFNAYYTRNYKGHGKGIFLPRYETSCGSHHSTGSFFTIAHEAGHSILDRFCPAYQDRIQEKHEIIHQFLQKEKILEENIEEGLSYVDPSVLKHPIIVDYLSCRALHEAFGDITGILGSLRASNDPYEVINQLNPMTCLVKAECSTCLRGSETSVDYPLNYHGRSLLLTRKFCEVLKAENERLGNGVWAMKKTAIQFLKKTLVVSLEKDTSPFDRVLELMKV
jgi:hypothetical protein